MVQDTGLGQEMFVSVYQKKDNGKLSCYRYTDEPVAMMDQEDHHLSPDSLCERSLIYCVSPPGQTSWQTDPSDIIAGLDQLSLENQGKHKYPLPDMPHKAAVVKFYQPLEDVKVGQLVDLLAVVSSEQQEEDPMFSFSSPLTDLNKVLVLHAITFRPVTNASPFTQAQLNDLHFQVKDIRTPLIQHIASYMAGDLLVAELILLQLLSRVSTQLHDLKIGQFALNITNMPGDTPPATTRFQLTNPASQSLASLLQSLLLHQVNLPLTLDTLNNTSFFPVSENEDLRAGVLQLVAGTHLLVDETCLSEGKLGDRGVRNMQTLIKVIQHQSLPYAFPYSQYDFDTDLSFITLSQGKSLLPHDCSLPWQPQYALDDLQHHAPPSDHQLNLYRMYLQTCRHGSYEIPEAMSQFIQEEFVKERKQASETQARLPTQEDLMVLMNLCRLVTLSFGETVLTKQLFDHALALNKAVHGRVSSSTSVTK
ncbi:hypothetical protein DM01DRAFT_1360985 [Hesseltinella vesiculosa]|uniref:Mini-chromosome maintenance complex-binding protein n=1 Tax=Hesseltinella vesiculosa TaxID=101127 RepID=A0A1X2GYP2_9FUNG|nr:hypothetical protein DM01DRAFT_1360985 [Hesseltinella vesiculosa]